MIRTLVVDDDFRVAKIHATSVERVPGFVCVGEAHTSAAARQAVRELEPDLLLLDIYLPDEDGLSLLRSLKSAPGPMPDCIVVTAARDLKTARTALQLGAAYYLVKPFGFAQLRDQLDAYRRWRDEADAAERADQATIDTLYHLFRPQASTAAAHRRLPPTIAKILDAVTTASSPISAALVAKQLGLSRPTAQRYLTELERRGLVELDLEYGSTGRPVHRYRPANPGPS
jgi:response regulator of citrate/malate metabolism